MALLPSCVLSAQVQKAIAQLKLAFDNLEKQRPALSRDLLSQMFELIVRSACKSAPHLALRFPNATAHRCVRITRPSRRSCLLQSRHSLRRLSLCLYRARRHRPGGRRRTLLRVCSINKKPTLTPVGVSSRDSTFRSVRVGPVHDPRSPPGHLHDLLLDRGHLWPL